MVFLCYFYLSIKNKKIKQHQLKKIKYQLKIAVIKDKINQLKNKIVSFKMKYI